MRLKRMNCHLLTNMAVLLFIFELNLSAHNVEGFVFLDKNKNGMLDKTEKGISGIWVSNQKDLVQTDMNGFYRIESIENKAVYVVRPSGYSIEKYYADAEELSDFKHNFPLVEKAVHANFDILVVGDPQMRTVASLEAFKEDIVEEMLYYNPEFAMVLGDIADNDLSMYPYAGSIMDALPYPVYKVFGNHDVNYRASSVENQSDKFVSFFGPDYYSFNEGNVHFIVLDNIRYQGWNMKEDKQGSYFGGLSDVQYEWLKKDLEIVPSDDLIVLAMHIPLLEQYTHKEEIQRIFNLLKNKKNVLSLSGHLHAIENYFFNESTNWSFNHPFQNITVGAACGGWWCGPMDERGLPVSTCMDGSPNGYYQLSFSGNKYDYQFIPANHRADFQMRITFDESSKQLYANVFSATKHARVSVSINGGDSVVMKNTCENDPFINRTYPSRSNFDNWSPGKMLTSHLWKTTLRLEQLPKGIHRMDVTVEDVDGKRYNGHKLITVK